MPKTENQSRHGLLAELQWQMLSEPGDTLAGQLVRLIGPEQLLEELKRPNVQSIWTEYCTKTDPDLVPFVETAVQRMRLRLNRIDLAAAVGRAAAFDFEPVAVSDFPILERQFLDLGPAAPRVLWLAGNPQAAESTALGVVGSRQCSNYGVAVVRGVVDRLTDSQSVVSGGAIGIDAAAHRAAIENGIPTVSYLAGGPDRLYPSANLPLFQSIKQSGGALIAECAPGTPPGKWRFLQRNRLIAAHSRVLLVAECGYRSGARNTARIAGEIGRAVYAAPGPVTASASAGCNLMIAQGTAECMADFDEPVDALTGTITKEENLRWRPANERRVLDELDEQGQTLDDIAFRAGLSHRETAKALESLEERHEAKKQAALWVLKRSR